MKDKFRVLSWSWSKSCYSNLKNSLLSFVLMDDFRT